VLEDTEALGVNAECNKHVAFYPIVLALAIGIRPPRGPYTVICLSVRLCIVAELYSKSVWTSE